MAGRRSRRATRTTYVAAGVFLLLIIVLALVRVVRRARATVPTVDVAVATRGPFVVTVTASGVVDASDVREVKARVAGRVAEVLVGEGQTVSEGQLAARLDDSELAAQVEQARAQVRSAESDLYQLGAGASGDEEVRQAAARVDAARAKLFELKKGPTESQIAQAASAEEQARVALQEAESTRDRMSRLWSAGAVAKTVLDEAEAKVTTSRAAYEAARKQLAAVLEGPSAESVEAAAAQLTEAEAGLELARQRRRNAVEAKKAAEARLSQARAGLALAESQLALSRVVVPADGVVVGKPISSGVYVSPGTLLFKIGRLEAAVVRCMVDEVDIARVRVGQSARVTSDALGKTQLPATVSFISNKAVSEGGVAKFEVELTVDNADGALRPGMTADAEITVARKENAVTVPLQAVVQREVEPPQNGATGVSGQGTRVASAGEGQAVRRRRLWVSFGDARRGEDDEDQAQRAPVETEPVVFVVSDGKAVRRKVVTGLENVTDVEVLSGVEPGETVIIGDYQTLKTLRDGDRVSAVGASEGR